MYSFIKSKEKWVEYKINQIKSAKNKFYEKANISNTLKESFYEIYPFTTENISGYMKDLNQ